MIISPRRWGKSSLVEKVITGIQNKDKSPAIITLDLFAINSEEQFLESFARETIKASTSKWEEWMQSGRNFFKILIPKLSVGLDPQTDFSVSFDWKELKKHSDEILNLPETVAIKKKIKIIVCLDEFQQIAAFKTADSLERKLRSVWQKHKHVSYCLYGSKRHMMSDIFNNPSRPFYRFGDIMFLPKISRTTWVDFIVEGFKATDKEISADLAEVIAGKMQDHSWYVQQLAHYTWNMTSTKTEKAHLEAAIIELIQANTPLYQNEVESLTTTQINLLKAILKGETQLTSAAVMEGYQLGTPRNVSKNRTILVNNDLVQLNDSKLEFVDPAFEIWLRKAFFNEPYF
jgi:hypothetical protein